MILLTGSTGFIGTELIKLLDKSKLTILSRKISFEHKLLHASLEDFLVKDLISDNYEIAIHLGGLAHNTYNLDELRKINVESTVALAKQLAKNGLKRFIFISSVAVNGSKTSDFPFTEESIPEPDTDFGISKYEAELELIKLSKELDFELVIIRSALVYSENAPANFKKLLNLISQGIPLPLGLANNSRSFISVNNLCEFIALSAKHPLAADELFLISDDDRFSTKTLIKTIWKAKGIRSFLIPVPVIILKIFFNIFGRSRMAIQLFDNLEVDNSKAKNLLGWAPKQTMFDVFKQL